MDAQDIVLASYPDAEAIEEPPIFRHGDGTPVDRGYWAIFAESGIVSLGEGGTEDAAWENAASKMSEGLLARWLRRGVRSDPGHPRPNEAVHRSSYD
jgi:hypothetical protein